jgi:hypothetical protein
MSYLGNSYNSNRVQTPLTIEQIARYAPSAMATRPHESRSERYTYIPTVNIIEGMIKAGFQPFSASQSRSRIEGKSEFTKHMIRFRHESVGMQSLAVGEVAPEVVLINSHDGTSTYNLISGLFVKVCTNGLMVSESEISAVKVMHKGDILQNVIEGSYRLIEDSTRVLGTVQTWGQLQLSAGEQNALADAARTLRFADAEGKVSTPITAAQLLQPRRYEDNKPDLWNTFNRVQENVIKGGLRAIQRDANGRRLRAISTRQVRGIDHDVKLNRALWQLAERMAELKAA